MNTDTINRYRSIRSAHPGMPARYAYQRATAAPTRYPFTWDTDQRGEMRAEWEQDGFKLVATLEVDELPVDYLGTFTAKYVDGAIPHDQQNHRTLDWFLPEITHDEHYRGLQKLGYSRHVADCMARSYVRDAHERATSCGRDWSPMVVVVRAYRHGIELGSGAVGGVESDAGEEHLSSVAVDCATEAMGDAKLKLQVLREEAPL